ncbi:hypothetical protein Nepgr_020045 [Nepenthes gracilis]|uniref:Transcription factor PosF21 n=1 Tax=Nepenthes gracilis TaxID=150966 RepID=A0AAD3SW99_NEPGR|nr:hypothetical protein Nepgr_020045 [Nepenthes gracilis]
MRYIAELERKVQTLQTEATSLSAQLTILQRDTNSLAAENSELKLRLQSMEQQVHLQDALNDTLKEEIHHLKILTGQTNLNGGPMMKFPSSSYRGSQPLYPSNQAMQTLLTAQQLQQLQIHSQNPQHQLHQLQQHAQQEQPQQQQQLTEDLKISGGSMLASSQKENASDLRTPVSKD